MIINGNTNHMSMRAHRAKDHDAEYTLAHANHHKMMMRDFKKRFIINYTSTYALSIYSRDNRY